MDLAAMRKERQGMHVSRPHASHPRKLTTVDAHVGPTPRSTVLALPCSVLKRGSSFLHECCFPIHASSLLPSSRVT